MKCKQLKLNKDSALFKMTLLISKPKMIREKILITHNPTKLTTTFTITPMEVSAKTLEANNFKQWAVCKTFKTKSTKMMKFRGDQWSLRSQRIRVCYRILARIKASNHTTPAGQCQTSIQTIEPQ